MLYLNVYLYKKLFRIFNHYLRKKSNLLNFASVTHYSFPIKNFKSIYKSKFFNFNFIDQVNIFKVKDVIINIPQNCIQKNNVTFKKNNRPILKESLNINFYFNMLNIYDPDNLKYSKIDRVINNVDDIYYFDIKENKANYYHFVNDNLINLIFFLENYQNSFCIVYNSYIANHINQYMKLISIIYNKKIIELTKNQNYIIVKNHILFASNLSYQKDGNFIKKKHKVNIKKVVNPNYLVSNFPVSFYNKKGIKVYNQYVGNLTSNSAYKCIDSFLNKLIKKKIIKKKHKLNYYITRIKEKGFKNKTINNEEKLIKYLKKKKFKIISFENKTVVEQIEIMYNSNVVLGVWGANLTNCIFKKRGGTLIELYPDETQKNADFYAYIAEQRKINFFRLNCKQNLNSELLIDMHNLKKILNKV